MFDPLSDQSASAWGSQPSAAVNSQPQENAQGNGHERESTFVTADLGTPPTSPGFGGSGVRRGSRSPLPPNPSGPPGREPQIYGEPGQGLITPPANGAHAVGGAGAGSGSNKAPFLRVRVTALDRNRRDIIFRMDAQTNLPSFDGNSYRNISRTYVEFQNFHSQITYSNPQTIIPALPLPQTSAPTDEEDDRIIKIMLQRWLTRICEDPVVLKDDELRSFIESEFGYSAQPRPRRKAGTGFSLIRRAPPDEDEHLQQARFELTKLETLFTEAAKSVDKLSKARRAVSQAQMEMGNKLISVATTEVHPPLGAALRKYGRSVHIAGDIIQAEAMAESTVLGDTLGYQGMNARGAKETLQQRSLALEEYQVAVKSAISKRRNIERLKASSSIRPDRVDEALEELEEANKYEQVLARRVDGISSNLHRALQVHNKRADSDLSAAFIEHARSAIMYERQMLKELEALRPDFANANAAHVPPPKRQAPPPILPAAVQAQRQAQTQAQAQGIPPHLQQQQHRQHQHQHQPPQRQQFGPGPNHSQGYPAGVPPPTQTWQPPSHAQHTPRGPPPPIHAPAPASSGSGVNNLLASPSSSAPSMIHSPLSPSGSASSPVGRAFQGNISLPPSSPGAGSSTPAQQSPGGPLYPASPLHEPSYSPNTGPSIASPQPLPPHAAGSNFRQAYQQPDMQHQQYSQQNRSHQQQNYQGMPSPLQAPTGVSQSMFITPPSQGDPLGAQGPGSMIGRPGSASPAMGYRAQGYEGGVGGVDPLSQSMRVTSPRRPKLDARVAASKLANLL